MVNVEVKGKGRTRNQNTKEPHEIFRKLMGLQPNIKLTVTKRWTEYNNGRSNFTGHKAFEEMSRISARRKLINFRKKVKT